MRNGNPLQRAAICGPFVLLEWLRPDRQAKSMALAYIAAMFADADDSANAVVARHCRWVGCNGGGRAMRLLAWCSRTENTLSAMA